MAYNQQLIKTKVEEMRTIELEVHEACFSNESEKVTYLLRIKHNEIELYKIDQNGSLFFAIDNQNATIVEELLKIGCNPNIKNSENEPALFAAFWNGNEKIISLILSYGAIVEHTLMEAIWHREPDIVEKSLAIGVNIDGVEAKIGSSPLHIAIMKCDLKIVKLLLEHNANLNFKEKSGLSPLIFAVSHGYVEIVKELLKYSLHCLPSASNFFICERNFMKLF